MLDVARLGMEVDTSDVKNASRDLDRFSRDGEQAAGQADRVGKSGKSMAAGMRTAATAIASVVAAAAAFTGAVRTIASFEKQISTVGAISRATTDELAAMRDVAADLGSTTEFSATQAAQGLEFLSRAGFTASESIQAIPAVLDLATASAMGLGQSADITSNIMSAFSIAAENTASATDILAAASSRANTDVTQLGTAMSFVGPVASSLGIEMSDAAAAIGVLSDAGIQGSAAGTGLRRVLSSLANPTGEAADRLKAMGLQLEDLNPQTNDVADVVERLAGAGLSAADALTIFGDRGGPAILALTSQTGKLRELTGELTNVEGEAARMADTMRDNLGGDLDSLWSSLQSVILALGEAGLTAALRGVIQFATAVVRGVTAMVEAFSRATGAVGDFFRGLARVQSAEQIRENAIDNVTIAMGDQIRATQELNRVLNDGLPTSLRVVESKLEEARARQANVQELIRERQELELQALGYFDLVEQIGNVTSELDSMVPAGSDLSNIPRDMREQYEATEQTLVSLLQKQQDMLESVRDGNHLRDEEQQHLDEIEENIRVLRARMAELNGETSEGVDLTQRFSVLANQLNFDSATESARLLAVQIGVGVDEAVALNNALNSAAGIQSPEQEGLSFPGGTPEGSIPGSFTGAGGELVFGNGGVRAEDFMPDRSASSIGGGSGGAARQMEELTEAARAAQQILGQVSRESVTYADVVNELTTALNAGKISQEQFNAGIDIASEKFDEADTAAQQAGQTLGSMFSEAVRNADSFSDALGQVLSRLGDMAMDNAFQQLFSGGFGGGSSGGGGLLGLGGFLGFLDGGGRIGAGQFGIVGERRPEIVTGPANVIGGAQTARMMQGGGQSTVRVELDVPEGVTVGQVRQIAGPMIVEVVSAANTQRQRQFSNEIQSTQARGTS